MYSVVNGYINWSNRSDVHKLIVDVIDEMYKDVIDFFDGVELKEVNDNPSVRSNAQVNQQL